MANKSKKIKVIAISILIIVLGAVGVYAVLNLNKLSAQRAVEAGIKAESAGDTEKALTEYTNARKLCAPKDDRCKVDMDMKTALMNDALKNEQNGKVGEPVSGVEITPEEQAFTGPRVTEK